MDLLGDLLGDLSMPSTPAPAPAVPPAALGLPPTSLGAPPGVAIGADLMGIFDGPSCNIPSAPLSGPGMVSGSMIGTTATPTVIPATQLPPNARQVEMDVAVRILAATNMQPSHTEIKLFLEARNTLGLHNLVIQLEPPSCLRTTVSASLPAEARGTRVSMHHLHSVTSFLTATCVCVQPLTSDVAILGQLSYADPQVRSHKQH